MAWITKLNIECHHFLEIKNRTTHFRSIYCNKFKERTAGFIFEWTHPSDQTCPALPLTVHYWWHRFIPSSIMVIICFRKLKSKLWHKCGNKAKSASRHQKGIQNRWICSLHMSKQCINSKTEEKNWYAMI